MCRNVDHGGRRCPSSALVGTRLEDHLQRKRWYYARGKDVDSWEAETGRSAGKVSPIKRIKWALGNGAQPDEIGLEPSDAYRLSGELPEEEWREEFKKAATGADVLALLENDGLTFQQRDQLTGFIGELKEEEIFRKLMEGDGEIYPELNHADMELMVRKSPFGMIRRFLEDSPVGRAFDAIVGISHICKIFRPLTAPIRWITEYQISNKHYLAMVKDDVADGRLYDLPAPVYGEADLRTPSESRSIFYEFFANTGARVGRTEDGSIVIPPDSLMRVREVEKVGESLRIRAEIFTGESIASHHEQSV